MQIFFKSRESARKASFGSKVADNGQNATKRWGRLVEAKLTTKEILSLTCTKDYRYPEKAKSVELVKIKKNKLKCI